MGPKKFGVAGARLLRWGVDDPLETCHPIYVTLPNLIVPLSYAIRVYIRMEICHKNGPFASRLSRSLSLRVVEIDILIGYDFQ